MWYRTHWQKTVVRKISDQTKYTIYWPSGFSSRADIIDSEHNVSIASLDKRGITGTATMKQLDEALALRSTWPFNMSPTEADKDAGEEEDDILNFEPGAAGVAINYKSGNRRLAYFPVIRSERVRAAQNKTSSKRTPTDTHSLAPKAKKRKTTKK
jgi:hypothetical protein